MSTPQPAPLAVACPSCEARLKVPAALAGKTIKCKSCGTAFKVAAPPAVAKAVPAEFARPAKAAPVPPPPPADAPLKLADDDDEGGQYGVQHDDSHIARCPRCAKELDPPDTRICLNCGYDMLARKRHESKKVYELTNGDYFKHLAPGVLAFLGGAAVLGGAIFCSVMMRGWLTGSFLDSEEKDPTTLRAKFYVEPFCFNIWLLLIGIFVMYKLGRFAVVRLFINWRPHETIKKD